MIRQSHDAILTQDTRHRAFDRLAGFLIANLEDDLQRFTLCLSL